MKLWDFKCRHCGHVFEDLVRSTDEGERLRCPSCGEVGADVRAGGFALGCRAGRGSFVASAASSCSPRGGFT